MASRALNWQQESSISRARAAQNAVLSHTQPGHALSHSFKTLCFLCRDCWLSSADCLPRGSGQHHMTEATQRLFFSQYILAFCGFHCTANLMYYESWHPIWHPIFTPYLLYWGLKLVITDTKRCLDSAQGILLMCWFCSTRALQLHCSYSFAPVDLQLIIDITLCLIQDQTSLLKIQ